MPIRPVRTRHSARSTICRLLSAQEGTVTQTRTPRRRADRGADRRATGAAAARLTAPAPAARAGPARPAPRPALGQRLGRLGPLVTFLRWASLAVGVVARAHHRATRRDPILLVAVAVLLANTIFRTIRPLRLHPATWRAEAIARSSTSRSRSCAIALTGDWTQPVHPHAAPDGPPRRVRLGLPRGPRRRGAHRRARSRMADVHRRRRPRTRCAPASSRRSSSSLAAVVGGFTRQLVARGRATPAGDRSTRSTRMAIANDLLHALHDVVQTLPASLDLSEVVASAQRHAPRRCSTPTVARRARPRRHVRLWRVELAEGARLSRDTSTPTSCPPRSREALDRARRRPRQRPRRPAPSVWRGRVRQQRARHGPARPRPRRRPRRRSSTRAPTRTPTRTPSLIAGLASSLALAVDNARWFGRLRTLGAEAERARIARDLHDRRRPVARLRRLRARPPAQPPRRRPGAPRAPRRRPRASSPSCARRSTSSARPSPRTQDLVDVARAVPHALVGPHRHRRRASTPSVRIGAAAAPGRAGAVAHPPGSAHERRAACRCLARVDHLEDW